MCDIGSSCLSGLNLLSLSSNLSRTKRYRIKAILRCCPSSLSSTMGVTCHRTCPRLISCRPAPPTPPPRVSTHPNLPTKTNSPASIPSASIAGATVSGHTSSTSAMASNNLNPREEGGRLFGSPHWEEC